VIKRLTWGIVTVAFVQFFADEAVFAQMGMPSIPGMGGGMGGGTMTRPKRQLRKSRAPVLSPALNLLPGAAQSFEGQFLLRQLPQEQALKQYQQTGKALDTLQHEVVQTENQIKTGVKSTGHRTQFMNYGGYYSGGRGRSR
jgi:hypothetical protein